MDTLHTSIVAFAGPLPRIESLNAANVAAGIHTLAVDVSGANSTRDDTISPSSSFSTTVAPPRIVAGSKPSRGIATANSQWSSLAAWTSMRVLGRGAMATAVRVRIPPWRVVFGDQRGAVVGRERRGDGELDGRAVEHGVLGPRVLLLLGGALAAGFGLGLGGLVAVGGRLGLGFGQVPLERNLRQRVRSADRLDAGGEREHVDADGSDRGLAPVNGDDHGRAHERGHERGAGRPALERLDVIEDARAIFAGLDGLRLHGPLLAGKGERHLDGLGGRGFRLLLALGLDPRGDERGDRLGEKGKGKERWRGAGSATRNLRLDPKKAPRRVAGRGGARGRDAHLDGHVYGERGRTRILGSLGLPIGVSRFLLAHGLAL